jgi:hypothetical protein
MNQPHTHILCDRKGIAYLRFRHMGHYVMEPGEYQDAPISKILHSVQGLKQTGMHNRPVTVVVQESVKAVHRIYSFIFPKYVSIFL